MGKIIKYEKFFVYSSLNNKYFYTEFNDGINLIYGKNTSGKSTLIQAIHYTFGINDEKHKLKEILDEKVLFRLDFLLIDKKYSEKISIIRDNDVLIIKRENYSIKKFIGINSNNSYEHKLLKIYLAKLLGSTLYLQSTDGFKPASIEAMFLPYYVAQDVGWIARHKSFRDLDFIKNFKNDFFDYYLGITDVYDREEKERLINKKRSLNNEISTLEETETKDKEFQLAKLLDEQYINITNNYLEKFKIDKDNLITFEKDHIELCNKLSFKEKQIRLLSKVKSSLQKQQPGIDKCPTCNQYFSGNLEDIYEYHQNKNDTEQQINNIKEELKKIKSKIDSIQGKTKDLKDIISKNYSILSLYKIDNLTLGSWIDNKVNIKLSEKILSRVVSKKMELNNILKELKKFKTDDQINIERNNSSNQFRILFKKYLAELGVKTLSEQKYYLLYQMPTFLPKQGVELLKTMLAYNFAFIKLISNTEYVHKLPLMLDAIFKEDVDTSNRNNILEFIYNNKSISHQMIITIADSEINSIKVTDYNKQYFKNTANLILISEIKERAFLSEYNNECSEYLEETIDYLS